MKKWNISSQARKILLDPWSWKFACQDEISGDEQLYNEKRFMRWFSQNRHKHNFTEAMITLSGKTYYGIGDSAIIVQPGTVIALGPSTVHQKGYPSFYPDCEQAWFEFLREHTVAHLWRIRKGKGRILLTICLPRQSPLKENHDKEEERLLVMSELSSAALKIFSGESETRRSDRGESFQKEMIQVLCRHLADTTGKGVSLDSLSRISGYSKFHMLKLFKKFTGLTIWNYLNKERLRKFRELQSAGKQMKEIGYELGFLSPSAFSHWVRKYKSESTSMRKISNR